MIRSIALVFIVALCHVAVAQEDECYDVQSAVGNEPDFAADVCAINEALDNGPDYDTARDIYENGRGDSKVTLQELARAEYPTDSYQKYATFFEDDRWMDTLIIDAFNKKAPFTTDTKRVQMIKKLLQSSVLVQQVFFHIDSALDKAESNNPRGALVSWDKGMATYYGAEEQCSPFGNGQARGIEFDTMRDGVAMTNSAVHGAFLRGGEALQQDTLSSDNFQILDEARLEVIKQVTIIYIQAVFKYATLMDEGLEDGDDVEKAQAEGFAYFHAIIPLIADIDRQGADAVLAAFNIADEPDEDLAEEVKPILRDIFDDLGIDEDEVNDFDGSRKAAYVIPEVTSCRLDNQFSDGAGAVVPDVDG